MAANVDLTVVRAYDDAGIRRRVIGTYTGPTSYTQNAGGSAGGDPFLPSDTKLLGEIEFIDFEPAINTASLGKFYTLRYSARINAVIWFDSSTGTEATGGSNLSAYGCRFEAMGK